MSDFLLLIWSTGLQLLAVYLLLNVLYLLFFAIAGFIRQPALPPVPAGQAPQRVCVLIPAYRTDAVILETAPAAARHAYAGHARVHVVADGLQPDTVHTLRSSGIEVHEVSFVKSTKGQALRTALENIPNEAYDVALVLDVDNVMGNGFLNQVNQAFAAGYRVVQGHRTAKNLDSPFAVLDACNEEINNSFFRQGPASLGMSSALIGSGMAFEFRYLKELLATIGETAGEDKELEFRILRDRVRIGYLPEAYVYDEKIPNAAVFTTQRTRWLALQLDFLRQYFFAGWRELLKGNVEFFNKAMQTLLMPRLLLLGLLGAIFLLSMVLSPWLLSPWVWAGLLGGTSLALLLALPGRLYSRPVAQAIWHLPLALGAMMLAILQLKKAKSSFLPTPHTHKPDGPIAPSQ
jgi:cellulose synthase/poly-beta-1,6-N-acetylglucosamine synthase-like glycosyltransferase